MILTLTDVVDKIQKLCAEYNLDDVAAVMFLQIVVTAPDWHTGLQTLEEELKRRGPKED